MTKRLLYMAVLTTALLFHVAKSAVAAPPKLDGRWEMVALIQDGEPAEPKYLKDAYVDIHQGKMVFHVPSRPTYPDLQIRYKFVSEGIDIQLTHGDIDAAIKQDADVLKAKGSWEIKDDNLFRFALHNTDDAIGRPSVRPMKDVIYVELRRSPAKIQ